MLLSGLCIYSFRFGSALNPDSFIRMHCRYGPWIFLQMDSACGVYRPYGLVFYHRLCNRSQRVSCFHVCYCDLSGVAYSPICFQAALNGMSKSMSRSNIAAPGEAFNTLWCV